MPKATQISICAKCSDMCSVSLIDEKGNTIGERDGYVPNFMPGEHFGDYVMLDIDLETGKILNWKKPTQAQLDAAFENEKNHN
jgi:hypothetical protein